MYLNLALKQSQPRAEYNVKKKNGLKWLGYSCTLRGRVTDVNAEIFRLTTVKYFYLVGIVF